MATILVVDDYPVITRMLTHMLRKQGHAVTAAGNGEEASALLTAGAFDLVITDVSMPEMDGLTLLRHLRASARFRALPVIVLTASGEDHDALSSRADRIDALLTKPTSSRELVDTVARLLT